MRLSSLLLLLFSFQRTAQTHTHRGLYVDGFASILGNEPREDSLLLYAHANRFTALTLYEVHRIDLTKSERANALARFIRRARVDFGIEEISVAGENAGFFAQRVIPYNHSRSDTLERFTTLNVEFEYWNDGSTGPGDVYCEDYLEPLGYPCTRAGAFSFFMTQLRAIDSTADANGLRCELYVGWFTQQECDSFLTHIDRLLLHAYVTDPDRAFPYTRERIEWLEGSKHDIDLAVLFSAEQEFLKPWMHSTDASLDSAHNVWRAGFEAAEPWAHVHPIGSVWFTYGEMPYTLPVASVEQRTRRLRTLDLSRLHR